MPTKQHEDIAQLFERLAAGEVDTSVVQTKFKSIAVFDADLESAFHFLQHFESDEDIRARDASYAKSQVDALKQIAAQLRKV